MATNNHERSRTTTNDFEWKCRSWSFVVIRGHSWRFVVVRGHSWSFVVFHKCIKNNQVWQLTKVYNSTNLLRMARIVLKFNKKTKIIWIFLLIYERSQMTENDQKWPRMTTNDHERPRMNKFTRSCELRIARIVGNPNFRRMHG